MLCNSGDVFVLDAGDEVFEWHGAETDCFERKQALEMALRIKVREKGGRAKVGVGLGPSPFGVICSACVIGTDLLSYTNLMHVPRNARVIMIVVGPPSSRAKKKSPIYLSFSVKKMYMQCIFSITNI
jgi:hypothetical protein